MPRHPPDEPLVASGTPPSRPLDLANTAASRRGPGVVGQGIGAAVVHPQVEWGGPFNTADDGRIGTDIGDLDTIVWKQRRRAMQTSLT